MTIEFYPTLSEKGFVSSTEGILNEVMNNYYLTDEQQSLTYRRDLISMPKTYYLYSNDPDAFQKEVASDLEVLLRIHFEEVTIDTEVRVDPNNSARINVAIFASVIDKYGEKFSLGMINKITEEGMNFDRTIKILNYGDRYPYMEF